MTKEFTATARVTLDMPRTEVWRRMQDMTLSKYYVPDLLDCRVMTEQTTGVGTSRKVFMKSSEMDETVVEWTEGSGFVLRLHNGDQPPMLFSRAACSYQLQDGPAGRTVLEFSLTYAMRGGFLGILFAHLMINRAMAKSATAVAGNFKQYYETGQPSNPAYRTPATA